MTEVDHAVEDLIRAAVLARFPEHGILGEERADTGPADAEWIWVIDPLDGTSNFINGLPTFSCSVGVLWRGAPVVGAIFVATSRHLSSGVYHARAGGGAFFDDRPVRFPPTPLQARARLTAMPGGTTGVTGVRGRRFGVVRTLGSVAAELAYTAEGVLQMAFLSDAKVWDVAAGVAICQAAGAAVCVRAPRGGRWRTFTAFADGVDRTPTCVEVRAWHELMGVGDPALVPDLTRALHREQRPLAVIRRLLLPGN